MRIVQAAISNPDVSGIVVCGAAGVGKSRIAREALAAAAEAGSTVRWAGATASAQALPLGAFAAYAESATDSLQLVRSVIDSLTAGPEGAQVVLGVDDAHLLDDLSAFVLHQIVQRRGAKVILTLRDGEPVPPAVQDLWKGGELDRLDLQPLSMDELTALLEISLQGAVEPLVARRLWSLTRGNALYVRNIVEQEVGDGRLANHRGVWRWTGEPVLPPGLAELIDSRMGALPADVADVTDVLAVGEPIELASLVRITDADAVEEAEARGLISLEGRDTVEVRIAHPLYGEVRRNRAPATRLRRLRGLLANELAVSDHRDDIQVVVRRATLSLDADLTPEPDLFVRAAGGATWQVDVVLAERLARAAVRAGAGADAVFIHAYLLSWLGRGSEAEALLAENTVGSESGADCAKLTFIRATNRLFGLADDAGARQLIDEAEHIVEPTSRNCLEAARVVYCAATGSPGEALEAAQRTSFDDLPVAAARATAWAMTVAAGDAGRTTDAVAAAEAGYSVPIRGFLVICDAHANALVLAGHLAEAEVVAERLRQRGIDYPSPHLDPIMHGLAGRVALAGGRLVDACAILRPTVDGLTASEEAIGWTYRFCLPQVTALAMRGRVEDARLVSSALEQRFHPGWRYLDYERALALAWLSAAQGAVNEAIGMVFTAAETCRANGQFAAEVLCLQTAAQFGDGSFAARLVELAEMVEGPRARVAGRFAAAIGSSDAAELQAVADDFEQMGDLVAAADAAAHAAAVHRRNDRNGAALTCSARAEELARRCGGVDTPALRKALQRLPLTDREREVVMLIGEGLPTRQIAERLTLSVRTVEGHIYRAMAKTGAEDRDELAAMLPRF
jgi:DNA-binding CsgD family transcriptional regulator